MRATLRFRVVLLTATFLMLSSGVLVAQETGPAAPAAAPRFDKWIVIGPGGGGGQFYPTISPHDPSRVLVRCDMTGSFLTLDGGETWRMFNLRGATDFFLFDPADPDVIYVKNVGLYRSADSGRTWNLVFPNPSDVERFVIAGDHGEVMITVKGRPAGVAPSAQPSQGKPWGAAEEVTALAVDPADSKTLYAAVSGQEEVLLVSIDWGETWSKLAALPSAGWLIYVSPDSPEGNRTLYVVRDNCVSVLKNGKLTDYAPPAGVSRFGDASVGRDPKTGSVVIYGVTWARRTDERTMQGGIFVSRDGGASWNSANAGLLKLMDADAPAPVLRAIATCQTDGNVAYLSYNNLRTDGATHEGFFGVAKTVDAGKTWQLVWKEYDQIAENMRPAWLSYRFGPGWGENPISIGVAPGNPDIVYGTDSGRTMRSTDGGKTWEAVYSKKFGGGNWTTTGLDVTTCYGVHFDPFDKDRLFISYTDIGLFASSDYGVTWESATTTGVQRSWVNTTYWMEFDPDVKGRAWAVMSGTHDLPRPKMWRRGGSVRGSGGVSYSEDGGRTWTKSSSGMPETPCTHVLVDPAGPVDARILYVAGYGTGVWKSTDGGRSWVLKNNGIEGEAPFAWRFARDKNGVLYVVVARRSEDGSYGTSEDGALYRSTDGAETWQKIALPEGMNGPNGITVDPEDPNRLYLAVWGRYEPEGAVMGGIWLSTDAGKTWKCVLDKDQYIYDVTVDPRDPNLLYACGFSSSAWRSQDRGMTWTRIKGFNFKWGHRVIPDPRNADMIFVSTFGGSIWYGPAKGDPDAVEDIVTPVARY